MYKLPAIIPFEYHNEIDINEFLSYIVVFPGFKG